MEKDLVRWTILWVILFLSLWRYMGYRSGINKYNDYYYYYINQYPAIETINQIQDMSTEK